MNKKNILRAACFLALAVLMLAGLQRVFRFKFGGNIANDNEMLHSGIMNMQTFYKQPENSVDVLVLGTSHAFRSLDTGLLYDDYGIAAYNLCASSQSIWNTYYYLREGLKTQKPSLIVLESFGIAILQQDYTSTGEAVIIDSSLEGLKLSKNKLAAIRASVGTGDTWLPFLMEWTQYHSRYSNLTSEDYLPDKGHTEYYESWKGFETFWRAQDCGVLAAEPSQQAQPLYEKGERYYRAILELARQENIPVCVVTAPYPAYNGATEKVYYNTIASIAAEYGDAYIDYNTTEAYARIGLDGHTDFTDIGHMNYYGAEKFSKAFGQYLRDTYTLPDRTGDSAYASWHESGLYYQRLNRNMQLAQITEIEPYLQALAQTKADYTLLINAADCDALARYGDALAALGIPKDASCTNGSWVVRGGTLLFDSDGQDTYQYHSSDGYYDLLVMDTQSGSTRQVSLMVGTQNYRNVKQGLNILVWDNETKTVADSVGFYPEYNYEMERLSR